MKYLRPCLLWLCFWLAAPAVAVPALWQVSNGKGGTITLLGTIHLLPTPVQFGDDPPALPWLSPTAKAAFAAADVLIVETMIPRTPAERRKFSEKSGRLAKPVPVLSRLPARLRPKLRDIAEIYGFSVPKMALYNDLALTMTLTFAEIRMVGLDTGSGADVTLMAMARTGRKPIIGLEAVDAGIRAMDRAPMAEQRMILVNTVEHLDDIGPIITEMHDAWQAGHLKRLTAATQKDVSSPTDGNKRVFRDRNRAWADRIASLFTGKQRLFMAVGAGHMQEPDSLIPMLEARGFTVKRIE